MTPSKKKTSRRAPTTPRAEQVVALCRRVVEIDAHFEQEASRVAAWKSDPLSPEHLRHVENLEAMLVAARDRFARLVVDDLAAAVAEFDLLQSGTLDPRKAGPGRRGVRDAALARAVEHVAEWLHQRQGGKPRALAFPIATLGTVAKALRIRSDKDVVALLGEPDVKEALRPAVPGTRRGPRVAAECIVAIVAGEAVSTVRRAAGSKRSPK